MGDTYTGKTIKDLPVLEELPDEGACALVIGDDGLPYQYNLQEDPEEMTGGVVPINTACPYLPIGPMVIPNPIKKEEALNVLAFLNTAICEVQYFLPTDTTLATPLQINNYEMSNYGGLPQLFTEQEIVEKTFEWCPTGGLAAGTYADVLAAAIAALGAGAVLPNGNTPDGIIELEVYQEYKGQRVNGKKTDAVGTTIGTAPFQITMDGGQRFCEKLIYRDKDCDGKADACYDLTTPFIVPDKAGLIIKVKLVECDPDPTDENV